MLDDVRRPKTQHSAPSLKALRYEDVQDGIPPRRHVRLMNDNTPPTSTSTSADSTPLRPRTSPSPSPITRSLVERTCSPVDRASFLSQDFKRDSAIAPSVSSTGAASSIDNGNSGLHGAAREPTLPTIVVQDEELSTAIERSRSPFAWKSKKEKPQRHAKSVSPPRPHHMSSSKGIQAGLPTARASADDIGLEDLASDKVEFSARGSILFGGKKMQDLINAQGDDQSRSDAVTSPVPTDPADASHNNGEPPEVKVVEPDDSSAAEPQQLANGTSHQPGEEHPRMGLVAGPRQPSVQMMNAAFDGGRVLSTEEVTFSMKVRSMYEHGDERAADWIRPPSRAMSGKTTPESSFRDTPTPDVANGELTVNKTRPETDNNWPLIDNRSSYTSKYSREAHELAGGIEDWGDVDGKYVDRYGFIRRDRLHSRNSVQSLRPTEGMQRVATSLRVETEQPRRERSRLIRKPSDARSSRSVPPKSSKEWTIKRGPGSVHSTHTTTSTSARNPFRSRSKRLLADASDMLTLPPGLEDIDENQDAGQTASSLKQREWAREEKWQKMAKPVNRSRDGKGGGMHFDFDTTDPKLVERTWKGIPDRWRASAWHSFLAASAKKRNSSVTDQELIGQFHKLQELSCADDVQIDVDVPRTIQLHIMFRRRYRGGQRLLFRVLHAMALYFPEVGYVQGMASIAVTLLCYFDEENAFVMMARMWQLRGLENFFKDDFKGLMSALKEFETDWLRGGDVAVKLNDLGVNSDIYGTRWYLTLFNMSLPFPAQLRVWDVFLLLGDDPTAIRHANTRASSVPRSNRGDVNTLIKSNSPIPQPETSHNGYGGADISVLHATSAALIDATRNILLDSDFENAMKVLTSFVPIRDEDVLMRVAKTEWKLHQKNKGGRV